MMTADEVKKVLGLAPHPREGGWYVRTYEAGERVGTEAFAHRAPAARYAGARLTGTAIYYLLEPGTFSEMHRMKSDEVFHFYAGDPVEMVQLQADGSGAIMRIGNDLAAGERPQVVVPRGVWQGSRLAGGGTAGGHADGQGWALLGCTVSPGFEFEDYEQGDPGQLCAAWPAFSGLIRQLTRG
jgi:predicted cupin superfamily sugar epimerase